MNKTEVMKALASLGNERHLKTFARHGVEGAAFGVPYADLYKLQKKIGVDQALAEKLWETGNHDARILATFVADPGAMKAGVLDSWAKTATNQLSLDAIAHLAAKSPHGPSRMRKWMQSRKEWHCAAGWHVLAALLVADIDALSEDDCADFLAEIEEKIHGSQNRVKHEMNGALIAISMRSPALRKQALAAAARIGHVEVDHGKTACKTPDATAYIKKIADRAAKKKAAKKTTKRKAARKKVARRRA